MVFSDENKILLKNLYQFKANKATELVNEFLSKWRAKVALSGS